MINDIMSYVVIVIALFGFFTVIIGLIFAIFILPKLGDKNEKGSD